VLKFSQQDTNAERTEKLLNGLESNPYVTTCNIYTYRCVPSALLAPRKDDRLFNQCCRYVMSLKTLPQLKEILIPDINDACLSLRPFNLAIGRAAVGIQPRTRDRLTVKKSD